MKETNLIKVGKMPRDSKYYQGYFHPKNPEKYIGNISNIVYRSSWELKFMRWCDDNSNILNYGSEELYIPYYDPVKQRVRKYYPDFFIKVKESNGSIKKYIIEIKPKRQTEPPKTPKRKTKSYISEVYTYATNEAKWKAAVEFCKDHMIEFKIITEDHLNIK